MPRGGVNIVLKEVEALRPGKEPKAKGMPTMEAQNVKRVTTYLGCLLYTSDAADDSIRV